MQDPGEISIADGQDRPAIVVDVSVMMPVRNGGRFLAPALESVLAQEGISFELICIDDGSTDGSWETLNRFAAADARMRVFRATGRGIAEAVNQAAALARGRYLARMDQDDVCVPGRFATQVRYLDSHPDVGLLGTQAAVIDEAGTVCGRQRVPVGSQRVEAALETSSPIIHPTVMMRPDALLAAGSYRKLFDAAEDYDLWLRIAAVARVDNLPQTLLLYRRHPQQATAWRPFRQARRGAIALVAYRLRRAGTGDPLAGMTGISDWRRAFAAVQPGAVDEVRQLTACLLADNGGTLRPLGLAYFRLACRSASKRGSAFVRRRLALACLRHNLQTLRHRPPAQAARTLSFEFLRWPRAMVHAFFWHGSIFWRATPP